MLPPVGVYRVGERPLAAVMAKARPRTAVVVTGCLAGLSYGYGVYLLLVARVPL